MRNFWKHILPVAALLLLFLPEARAQYELTGSDPARLRWNILKGEHFDVIYPREVDSLARLYLYNFEKTRPLDLEGLKITTPRMPIVLHPYNINSNGEAVWAPRRLEVETTPPFDPNSSQNWDYLLALHEGRHVGQMVHYTQGVFKGICYLFGEQGIGVGIGLYTSSYNLEGDAVVNETDLSPEGRGRRADFLKYYRAAFHSGEKRSYQQWRLGSLIRYTPNAYAFGYLMTSGMRYASGNYYANADFMNYQRKIFWRVFTNTDRSFKYASGLDAEETWNAADRLFKAEWERDYALRQPFTGSESLLAKRGKPYLEVTNPIPTKSGVLVAAKGMEDASRLECIDENGKSRSKKAFPSNISSYVPLTDSTILFAEVVSSPLWEHESFSILRTYDFVRHKFRNITRRTRFFNPAVGSSPDEIYAVEYPVKGNSNVVKVDGRTGRVLKTIKGPEGGQIVNIGLLSDELFATIITLKGQGIYRYNPASGLWDTLAAPQPKAIVDFTSDGDSLLYFVSDLDGVDNVFSFNPKSKSLQQLTSVRFGAKDPYIDKTSGQLFYSEYDTKGYFPVRTPLDSLKWKPFRFEEYARSAIADSMSRQAAAFAPGLSEQADSLLRASIDAKESKPYSKFGHLLHVHSWAPVYASVDKIMNFNYEHFYDLAAVGATVISQNTLGTAVATAGYSYHKGFHAGHVYFKYTGWRPNIELSADVGDRYKTVTTVTFKDGKSKQLKSETYSVKKPSVVFRAAFTLPINLSRSGWLSRITPSLQYTFRNDEYSLLGHDYEFKRTAMLGVNYYRMRPTPSAKIYPQWGIGGNLDVKTASGLSDDRGFMAYANVYGYLPGIGRNQGIRLSACYQRQFSRYSLAYIPNVASLPRGYAAGKVQTDYAKVTLDYAIPLYFLDGHNIFLYYIKRMQLIPFVDYAHDRRNGNFLSGGCDLLFDFNPIRISYTISLGVRYARTLTGENSWNLLTGFNF